MRCDYREVSEAQRRNGLVGQRCQRLARWKLWPQNGEGSTQVCTKHRDLILRRADLQCRPLGKEEG